MENGQQGVDGCYLVLKIVFDPPKPVGFRTHSEKCSISHLELKIEIEGNLVFALDSEDVHVYLDLGNNRHRLCQTCILFCEKQLLRWVMTQLDIHYHKGYLILIGGNQLGQSDVLKSLGIEHVMKILAQTHDEDSQP